MGIASSGKIVAMLSGPVSHGSLVLDRVVSRVLYERLRAKSSAQAAQFVDEFNVCRSARVDIAVVNDAPVRTRDPE